MNYKNMRKTTFVVATAFLMASLLVSSVPSVAIASSTSAAGEMGTILIDYSHGAYKAAAEHVDQWLADNLTLLGFEVVFIWGGLNSTILNTADGLILPNIWGVSNGYLASEVSAVGDWFNAGNKFLWVGGESDFDEPDGGQVVLDNQTLILEEVGSHVYHEPTAVQDAVSFAGASYRPVANITTDNEDLAGIVNGVDEVFMHSPTCLYGSNNLTHPGEGVNPVALETTSIEDVYVLIQHGGNATIVDSDITLPYVYEDGDKGEFVSVTLELNAGANETGALVVSGGNIIGHYWPMMESEYDIVTGMDGMRLVVNTIKYGMMHAMTEQGEGKILFDYSHGAYKSAAYGVDQELYTALFVMGYEVEQIYGGLNATILTNVSGLVLPNIWGVSNGYLASEITAVQDWFELGNKFLWVAGESDFDEPDGGQVVLDNQTLILEAVGSHVYHEPTAVQDSVSFAGASYRPVANITGDDAYIADIVNGVQEVFVHSPTCLYGSNNATPGEGVNPVALETTDIANVYVLLQFGGNATIVDSDITLPYVYEDGDKGEFVSVTMEINAGPNNDSVIVVSSGNIIGHYWPMMEDSYDVKEGMDGLYFVAQTIDFGMKEAAPVPVEPTTGGGGFVLDTNTLIIIAVAAVVVIIIIVIIMKRR